MRNQNNGGLGGIFRLIGDQDKEILLGALKPYLDKLDLAVNAMLRKKQESLEVENLTYNIQLVTNPKNPEQTRPIINLQTFNYQEIDGETVRVLQKPLQTSSMKDFVKELLTNIQ